MELSPPLDYAEITLNGMRPWRPDPTLSAWSGLHRLTHDFSAHPIHLPGQLCLAFSGPEHRDTWAPHGDRAFTLGPALTHYCCQRVYVVAIRSERITLTLAHFPLPLFYFAESDLPSSPDPSSTRPFPTLDGTDLIGRVFNDPDLGLCRVVEVGPPHRLVPSEGNLDPTSPQLQAGWVPTLRCTSLGGATHTSSITEVAEWVQTLAPSDLFPPPLVLSPPPYTPPPTLPPPVPQRRRSPRLQALLSSASAPTTPCVLPCPRRLKPDGAGKPLSFSSAIRGPQGKEWTLADEQELIKLPVTLKCLLPVMRPRRPPPILSGW
jgi:hypothetical protein